MGTAKAKRDAALAKKRGLSASAKASPAKIDAEVQRTKTQVRAGGRACLRVCLRALRACPADAKRTVPFFVSYDMSFKTQELLLFRAQTNVCRARRTHACPRVYAGWVMDLRLGLCP